MANEAELRTLQRKTAAAGAALMVIAFATGGLLAGAMTGKFDADPHAMSAAHLNALFGCLWLLALAYTLPMLRYSLAGCRRLIYVTALPAYANWFVTVIKGFLHVSGVDATGDHANDAIFAALDVTVVLPSFISAIAWTYGLLGRPRDPQ